MKLLMNKWLKVFSTEENKILVLNLINNVLNQPRSTQKSHIDKISNKIDSGAFRGRTAKKSKKSSLYL